MSSHLIAPEFVFFSKLGMVTMAVEPTAQLIVKNMYIYVHIQRHIYIYHNIILYIIKYSHMYIYILYIYIYIPTIILSFISLYKSIHNIPINMAKDSQSAGPVTQWLQQLRSYLDPPPRGAVDAPPARSGHGGHGSHGQDRWGFSWGFSWVF